MKHKPIYKEIDFEGKHYRGYYKTETDDHFYFRKSASISLNAEALQDTDYVSINLLHRNVIITAFVKDILEYSATNQYPGELKYYYPVGRWVIYEGDPEWVDKLKQDSRLGNLNT